jgi:Sec7-like guanine-nucleotide exchange factor
MLHRDPVEPTFVMATAMLMLNTMFTNPNMKPRDRMTKEGFMYSAPPPPLR